MGDRAPGFFLTARICSRARKARREGERCQLRPLTPRGGLGPRCTCTTGYKVRQGLLLPPHYQLADPPGRMLHTLLTGGLWP